MKCLRNLPQDVAVSLASMIEVRPQQVVSMALSKHDQCYMTLLAFDQGEGVSEESYYGDTFYYVLQGTMALHRQGSTQQLQAGECIAIPAHTPHAIGEDQAFKILQITLEF